jgi:pimeloyl-ACP methyl ester carboxylesterase
VTGQTRLIVRKSPPLVTFHVRRIGTGRALVLVHGSVQNSVTWAGQESLADELTLVLPDRPGYPPNPPLQRIDFAEQASDTVTLLGDDAHLGGFSYGGVIALLAAALRPEAVRSLMVIEPPCFDVARGVPAVEEAVARYTAAMATADPQELIARFAAVFGPAGRVRAAIPPGGEQGVRALMVERPPWEAEIPIDRLARIPALVCSGGYHPAYEAVCDALEQGLGAERAVLPGAGHGVHRAPGFNERYLAFLRNV